MTIDEVIASYLEHARNYYIKNGKPTRSQDEVRWSLSPLHRQYGALPATDFGPLTLKAFRQQLIEQGRWSRSSINRSVGVIKRMFKWAAENELVDVQVYQRLQTVSGLRRGRTAARETEPVRPVPDEQIEAALKHVAKPVAAMIELQRLTGMRPDEVVTMRISEIDRSGRTWVYTPQSHKTEHHGRSRKIYLGPRAQRTLIPFLTKDPDDFLFSPREADAEHRLKKRLRRKTPLSCGNRQGTNRKCCPKRTPGDRFTVKTYRGAITQACRQAYPPPSHLAKIKVPGKKGMRWETDAEWKARLGERKWCELKAWQKAHHWHPNQLRHNAATELRKQFGIEAARVVLGHSSAIVTEIYAELDFAKAEQIMSEAG